MLRARLNGRDGWIPIGSDVPARWVEVHSAGEIVRASHGLEASLRETPLIAARIWLSGCTPSSRPQRRIANMARQLLQLGMESLPHASIPLGCIPSIDVRDHGGGNFDVTLYTELVNSRGRTAIELAARAIVPALAKLAACQREPTVEFGRLRATRVRASCRVNALGLEHGLLPREQPPVAEAVLEPSALDQFLQRFGIDSHEPELAAAHNAYVVAHLTGAARALGLDAARVAAGADSEAARWGSCEPLGRWRRQGSDLLGQLEIPVDLDSACHRLSPAGSDDEPSERHRAGELLEQIASVGLVASLAYVRLALRASVLKHAADAAPRARARAEGGGLAEPPSLLARSAAWQTRLG